VPVGDTHRDIAYPALWDTSGGLTVSRVKIVERDRGVLSAEPALLVSLGKGRQRRRLVGLADLSGRAQ
jgi:hypothetical protein